MQAGTKQRRALWAVLAAVAAVALSLRVAAAQGSLWLDEAWSAQLARDAGDAAGVFFRINHDNNHLLNSLWLQAVGWGADPRVARGLSIASGTLAAVVAALIGARRSLAGAAVAGAMFAVSPIMVTYGADARGYAPMLLAFLVAWYAVERALAGGPPPRGSLPITLAGLLGTLAHATMLPGLLALAGAQFLALLRRQPPVQAAAATLRLMGGGLLASVAVLALVLLAAEASPMGLWMGALEPFTGERFLRGVAEMIGWTIGLPDAPPAALLATAMVAAAGALMAVRRATGLYVLAIFGLPLAVALFRLGNASFARYYLVSAAALLLLLSEAIAAALQGRRHARILAAVALALLVACAAWGDARLIGNRHADPGEAIRAMSTLQPRGTAVLASGQRDTAVLAAAAASAGYRLDVLSRLCPAPPFLFAERAGDERLAAVVSSCGSTYRPVAARRTRALSGLDWMLYRRDGGVPAGPGGS